MDSVTPLMEAIREREERKRLRKGHRRWHSTEHRIPHGGFHGSKETSLKTTPEWLRTPGYSSGGKDKASHRHHHSFGHCVVGCGEHIQEDGVVVGKERTRGTSRQDMSELKHHSTSLGQRRSRGRGNISQHSKCHSPGHLYSMLAGGLCIEEEGERLIKGFGGSLQTGSNRWSSSGDVGVRLGELLLTARGPPSHCPHKQPGVPKPTAPLPPTRHASHTMPIQQLQRPPGYHSLRQPGTPVEPHESHLQASLPSLSRRSWTMGSQSTRSVPRDAPQQDPAESDGEEEPSPAFLGSLDYHDFLHVSSQAKLTSSPIASLSPLPITTTSPRRGSHDPSPETM